MSEIQYKTVKYPWGRHQHVKGARCGRSHGGNHALTAIFRDGRMFECVGCGEFYTREQVAAPKDAPMGSNGVITG